MPVSGSTSVAAQRWMRLTTLSRALADSQLTAEQTEFMPGRPAGDIQIAAKTQRIDRRARGASTAATDARLMIETTFLATSEKLWPCAEQHLGRPAQLLRHEAAEERLDRQPSFLAAQVAARCLAAFPMDRQGMAASS